MWDKSHDWLGLWMSLKKDHLVRWRNFISNIRRLISFQLAEDIAAKDAAREEMERIRMELYLEEQEEKERQKERVGGSKCCVTSIEVDPSSVSQVWRWIQVLYHK